MTHLTWMDAKAEFCATSRFAVDEMMGKLARWMRMMGLDVAHRRPFPDKDLIDVARTEGRVIITRDHKFTGLKAPPHVWLIDEDLPFDQLVEVVRRAGIDPMEKAFTRCGICNTTLVEITKQEAAGRVPPFIFATHTEYRFCKKCEKVYWPGSHRKRMQKMFDEVKRRSTKQ